MKKEAFSEYNLYYRLFDGFWISRADLEKSYSICFGEYPSQNQIGFLKWLYSLLGRGVVEVCKQEDMDLKKLKGLQDILATRIYYDTHKCSLMEAKKYVDAL